MTDLLNYGGCTLHAASAMHLGARRALRLIFLALPLGLLACGGADSDAPAPTMVRVDVPPRATPATSGTASTGIELSGALNYQIWGNGDVATGLGATANAQITAIASVSEKGNILGYDTTITFAPAGPFATGLIIKGAHSGVNWPTDSKDLVVVKGGGVTNTTWPARDGFLSGSLQAQGNYFVFCSAGHAMPSVTTLEARNGAQVAVSSRFEPMDNLAALYGKSFNRYDCARDTNKTTFGDGKGQLTMTFDGMTLSEAQTVQAFSAAGFTPAAGQTIKRRAYSIVSNGATRYVVVALDNRGTPYASVLFQLE